MKFQTSELPVGKPQPRRKSSKLAPLVALTIFLTIPLYYPSLRDYSTKKLPETTPLSQDSPETTFLSQDSSETTSLSQDSEDSITLTTHIETPPTENVQEQGLCSAGQCSREDATAVERHAAPVEKRKHEKGRRKRSRRPSVSRENNRQHSVMSNREASREENRSRRGDRGLIRSQLLEEDQCDLFLGEWVPNPEGPYYTNNTCNTIQEHQNCLKFGRPDRGFLKWRWKPDDCELPLFDSNQFLELVRGKSIAFVGDSVARNHMQSLICRLSMVANPLDLSDPLDQNKRYEYKEHDFNISMFWSPYLVKTQRTDPNDERRPFNLYLDEFDTHWTTKIPQFDYVIISAGHWFFRPTYFYLDHRIAGCLYCPESNIAHMNSYFSYRRAFRTAFRAIAEANFDGVAFLRTFAPSHFEGGPWDKGGDCARTAPYKRNEIVLEDYSLEMYLIQLEELRIAQRAGRRTGVRFKLFDATGAMLLRADGHPSKYGHWPVANQTFANDCVHWCLPGPIDAWNDFLQELLKREIGDNR